MFINLSIFKKFTYIPYTYLSKSKLSSKSLEFDTSTSSIERNGSSSSFFDFFFFRMFVLCIKSTN